MLTNSILCSSLKIAQHFLKVDPGGSVYESTLGRNMYIFNKCGFVPRGKVNLAFNGHLDLCATLGEL